MDNRCGSKLELKIRRPDSSLKWGQLTPFLMERMIWVRWIVFPPTSYACYSIVNCWRTTAHCLITTSLMTVSTWYLVVKQFLFMPHWLLPQLRWKIWSQIRYRYRQGGAAIVLWCEAARRFKSSHWVQHSWWMLWTCWVDWVEGTQVSQPVHTFSLHPAHSYIRSVLNTDGIEASSIAWPLLGERLV